MSAGLVPPRLLYTPEPARRDVPHMQHEADAPVLAVEQAVQCQRAGSEATVAADAARGTGAGEGAGAAAAALRGIGVAHMAHKVALLLLR